MRVDAFDFELPEARIALRPAEPRDSARMLVVRPGASPEFSDLQVRDLPDLLGPDDALVVNDTRVIPAALEGLRRREGGSDVRIEATLVKRLGPARWRAFAKPGKRLQVGDRIRFGGGGRVCLLGTLDAEVVEKEDEGAIVLAFDLSGPMLDDAVDGGGAHADPALHRRPPSRGRTRPQRLPDPVRPQSGLGGGAHRQPALHARADGAHRRHRGTGA